MSNQLTSRNEQDTAWKEILDFYFKDCISYCLPHLSDLVDWAKPVTSLDKELQVITKGAKAGKRILDKLFKVFLKNGTEQWLLVHIEVQGTLDNDFPKRMFTYAYRIWDKYQQPLASCAILTDDNHKWRPNYFEVEFAGSRLSAEFLVIKLIDYRNQQLELEHSNNPFASVILVQLAALDAKLKPNEQRKNIKFMLTKRLYDKGFSKQEITNLYKFIDWCIGLTQELELEYLHEIYSLEEARKMPYISTAERLGIEKGIDKGRMQDAKRMLEKGLDVTLIADITEIPIDKIKLLKKN